MPKEGLLEETKAIPVKRYIPESVLKEKKQKTSDLASGETKTKPSEHNQHLSTEQVLKIFESIGFQQTQITAYIDVEENLNNEIYNNETLRTALKKILSKPIRDEKLILFRVNSITKSFVKNEGENNHFAALYFTKKDDEIKLTYFDPTGAKMSQEISQIISSEFSGNIKESSISLQFTAPETFQQEGEMLVKILEGNDHDCGVLLPLAIKLMRDGKNNIKLEEQASRDIGQILRQLLSTQDQQLDWNGIYKILHPEVYETNKLVEDLYQNRIIRLDTSLLFGKENLQGIKEIFAKIIDDQSELGKEAKLYIEDFLKELRPEESTTIDDKLKKKTLELLNDLGIGFRLSDEDGKCLIDNIFESESLVFKGDITVTTPQEGINVSLSDLERYGYQIGLSSQIYNPMYRIIVIDADIKKCLGELEFHEKIHILDHLLCKTASANCSMLGITEIGLKTSEMKAILSNIIESILPPQSYAVPYYLNKTNEIQGEEGGVRFGATEVTAFSLQFIACGNDFDKNHKLKSQELSALKFMIEYFGENVSKKQKHLVALVNLCKKFSVILDDRIKLIDENQEIKGDLPMTNKPSTSTSPKNSLAIKEENDQYGINKT